MILQEPRQRRPSRESAPSVIKGQMNGLPAFARRFGYRAGLARRPFAVALSMRLGPLQDLWDREVRHMEVRAHGALLEKEQGQ